MKRYINKKEFRSLLLNLFKKINEKNEKYQFVFGIASGGLHVSFPIACFFNNHHKDLLISFYDGGIKLKKPKVSQYHLDEFYDYRKHADLEGDKFLLVDDIIDSGSTLKWFINNTGLVKGKDFDVATLHWCKENSPDLEPEFYVEIKEKSDWIIYPWEV